MPSTASFGLCVERLLMDNHRHRPDARTSHLRTLSKILGTGLSAASRAPHLSARASRTSYSRFPGRQHLLDTFSASDPLPIRQPLKAAPSAGPRIVHMRFTLGKGVGEIFLNRRVFDSAQHESDTRERALSHRQHALETRRQRELRILHDRAIDTHGALAQLAVGF